MEPVTIGLLAAGAYMLLKKKSTASGALIPGTTTPWTPSADYEEYANYLDDWSRKQDAARASRNARYGAEGETWEEMIPGMTTDPMPGYGTPGLLGPAQAPGGSVQLGDELIPGIDNMWIYAGGAAAAYYFFVYKK